MEDIIHLFSLNIFSLVPNFHIAVKTQIQGLCTMSLKLSFVVSTVYFALFFFPAEQSFFNDISTPFP